MSAEPRIQFKKFKGFPELDFNGNARVPTHEFLIASKEVVTAIGKPREVTLFFATYVLNFLRFQRVLVGCLFQ